MSSPTSMHRKVFSFLNQLEEFLLGFLLLSLVFLGLAQILFRNILSVGLFWIDPLMRHSVLWIALLGASAATHEGRHIAIDLLPPGMGKRTRSWILAGTYCISALVCFILVLPAIRFVQSEYDVGKTLALGIPVWVSQSIMPLMLAVIGFRFLAKAGTLVHKNPPTTRLNDKVE
ncbi:MAG: TRAP transporter small permease [Thermodesulfobacteriota bacterium]